MSWDNASNMKAAMAAAKPQKLRAYEWCRLRNDFADMPIWRAVALKTGVHLTYVLSIVIRLEGLANRSIPRGSVADMSIIEFAASLDLRPAVVARVRAALEEPDIAWIDQDYVVDFHQRNPDHEDTTAAERQRRHRAKLKTEREQAMQRPPPAGYPPSRVTSRDVTRDTVTVTTDQIKNLEPDDFEKLEVAAATEDVGGAMPDVLPRVDAAAEAELWLVSQGRRVVTERARIPTTMADTMIARWRRDCGDDVVALVEVIAAAAAMVDPARSAAFTLVIGEQIKRRMRERELPLQHPLRAINGRSGL